MSLQELQAVAHELNSAADRAIAIARTLREAIAEFNAVRGELREMLAELREKVPTTESVNKPN